MVKYFLTLSLSLCALFSNAQNNIQKSEAQNAKWSLKFSPLTLIEPDQALSFATEIRVLPHIGLQLEGGFIFNTWYLSTARTVTNTRGFRLMPELRYYDIDLKGNLQRYLGVQLSYKQLSKDVEEWVNKTNYQQLENIHLKKYNSTIVFIAGLQNHAKVIGFDFNIGVGLKYKSLDYHPNAASGNLFPSYFGESATSFYPQFSTTFKLCYKIL